MKHSTFGLLQTGTAELGLQATEDQLRKLLEHLSWVATTNKRLNLTAIDSPEEAVRLHVLDSLTPLAEIERAPSGEVLDIGTGGGFPGLPLAVISGRQFTLLDSVAKKANALAEFVAEHEIKHVAVTAARSEQLARERPAAFAAVIARAVTALPALVELASPLLMDGGHLVALKGQPAAEELSRGDVAADIVGMRRTGQRHLTLPGGTESRVVLVYEKTGRSSVRLPRREGMAQRKPLA